MQTMLRVLAVVLLLCAVGSRARAEPATGFMLQGQIAANLVVAPGLGAYVENFSVMPSLRLGAQFRPLAFAVELNYSTFNQSNSGPGGGSFGYHVLAVGPDIQPVVWRSADGNARLSPVLGFNVGGVIAASSSGGGGGSMNTNYITGGLNGGLLGNYFLHRNFALGLEGGVRAQFVSIGGSGSTSTLYTVASIYVALSLTFVAGS